MARAASKPRLSEQVAQIAYAREKGRCAACGKRAPLRLQWHHIFPQSKWPELADNEDNIVACCEPCHSRHTCAYRRFPRSLCQNAEHLADDRMLAYLDRTYGPLA